MAEPPEPHSVGSRGAIGRHRLGPHVVGTRVVIRHLLPDGRATDVLGTCTAWRDDVVVVESDDGPVEVAVADIVTGKPVPPRASVRARVPAREVELHSFADWPEVRREPLGEWVVRSAPPVGGRLLKRTNSCLAMGDPGLGTADAAARVAAAYRALGQTPLVQVDRDAEVAVELDALGWRPLGVGDSLTLLTSTAQALRLSRRLSGRRSPGAPLAEDVREDGNRVEVVLAGGLARGSAGLDGDWLCLHSLHVDPAHRRTGLGGAVVAGLLDWGASRGAMTAWLHVEDDNLPARALYEVLGFRTHHRNRYLAPQR